MRRIIRRILIGLVITAATCYALGAIFSRREYQRVFPATDRQITENADSFTLFSVNPDQEAKPSPPEKTGNLPYFHEYPVLGAVQITDTGQRKSLMDDLYRQWHPVPFSPMCFFPRHGIRAVHNRPVS